MGFLEEEVRISPWERTVRGTSLGDDFVELQGVLVAIKDELDEVVVVFASLTTDPAGEGAYMEKECVINLLALCWLPRPLVEYLVDSNVARGDRNESDLMFRQSGESDASFRVISDPGLLDSEGRGGREGESADETEPAGMLIECAGLLRPRTPPIPRPRCEGLLRGKRFRGLSLNDEKGLGAVPRLSFMLSA
jgi:hypothetical protein